MCPCVRPSVRASAYAMAPYFCARTAYFVHATSLQPFACISNLLLQKSMFSKLGCIMCDTSVNFFVQNGFGVRV